MDNESGESTEKDVVTGIGRGDSGSRRDWNEVDRVDQVDHEDLERGGA